MHSVIHEVIAPCYAMSATLHELCHECDAHSSPAPAPTPAPTPTPAPAPATTQPQQRFLMLIVVHAFEKSAGSTSVECKFLCLDGLSDSHTALLDRARAILKTYNAYEELMSKAGADVATFLGLIDHDDDDAKADAGDWIVGNGIYMSNPNPPGHTEEFYTLVTSL